MYHALELHEQWDQSAEMNGKLMRQMSPFSVIVADKLQMDTNKVNYFMQVFDSA